MITKFFIISIFLFSALFSLSAEGAMDGPSEAPVEIRFSWWGGESRHGATLNAIEAYDEAHPGITVKPEYQGWSGYYEKLTTRLAVGAAPDIFQIVKIWFSDFKNKPEAFYDLRRLEGLDLSGWTASSLEYATLEGKLIGTPLGQNVRLLIYNKSLAEKLGLTIDHYLNWQEFEGMIQAAKKERPSLIGYSGDLEQIYYALIAYLVQTSGQPLITEEGEFGFSVEDFEKGLELFASWFSNGTFQSLDKTALFNASWSDPDWLGGSVLFSETPMTQLEEQTHYDFPVGITRYWVKDGARMTGIPTGTNIMFSVSGKTAHPEKTGAFLNYILTEEEGVKHMELQRGVPSNREALAVLYKAGYIDDLTNRALTILKDSDKGIYSYLDTEEIRDMMKEAIQVTGFGDESPAQAAAEFMIEGDALLGNYR